ncbi:response regulator [Neolewinella lacunae]|uniref:Response regulator n=1 Tax=Neolewinella lacunae TaxID=1517758 RepID=A0A923PKD5_9BACT|nr:response regulator [Neolewinella lacunae]MBC6995738.1 response regulator [Neolewinella lacunae]MDN3636569.1 response regulator [Neolewinella lacunae]
METTTILIIEDNEEVRENLAEILELYGYTVLAEPNGLAGVKTAIQASPDLILCDVMMPELDGYGVLNLLSENERTSGIPFIFLTARTEKDDIRRGMNLGADDYITKPFYKDELLSVIRTRLKKAKLRGTDPSGAATAHLSNPEGGFARLEKAFAETGRPLLIDAGQTIVREGEYPHFIYRVSGGRVHLSRSHEYGRDYIIAELGEGEVFGIPSVLERAPFHYTARGASSGATLQALATDSLLKLLNTDRNITEALMRLMASRVVAHSERLVHQAYDSVRRRTALVLCDLHQKYAGQPIELSREELAQMVGSTKESVIRALSDFKREGLVANQGKKLVIQEVEGLRGLLV